MISAATQDKSRALTKTQQKNSRMLLDACFYCWLIVQGFDSICVHITCEPPKTLSSLSVMRLDIKKPHKKVS